MGRRRSGLVSAPDHCLVLFATLSVSFCGPPASADPHLPPIPVTIDPPFPLNFLPPLQAARVRALAERRAARIEERDLARRREYVRRCRLEIEEKRRVEEEEAALIEEEKRVREVSRAGHPSNGRALYGAEKGKGHCGAFGGGVVTKAV